MVTDFVERIDDVVDALERLRDVHCRMAAFYLLPARAWELGVGGTLAAWEHKQYSLPFHLSKNSRLQWVQEAAAWLGLTLLVVSAITFSETLAFPGFAVVLAVLGTALLINTKTSWLNARLLSNRPIAFVGLISYSWYLWHWPLMSYLRIILPIIPSVWTLALVAALSFVVAAFSWWVVERPFRRASLGASQTLRRYAIAIAIALVFPVAIRIGNGVPLRLPYELKQLEAIAMADDHSACLASSRHHPNFSNDCVVVRQDRPAIALIGDSHAAALAPGIRELSTRQNLSFKIFSYVLCPPLLNVSVEWKKDPGHIKACAAFVTTALRNLVSDTNVQWVILAGQWYGPLTSEDYRYVDLLTPEVPSKEIDLLRKGLIATIDLLGSSNKQVVLVEDNPHWAFDPFRLEIASGIPLRNQLAGLMCPHCAFPDQKEVGIQYVANANYKKLIQNLHLKSDPRIDYLDLWSRFCDSNQCNFKDSGGMFFFDQGHLSAYGARYAVEGVDLFSK